MGGSGNAAAGTLNFGSAEGVVWAISANTNTIGAVIDGSNGLTKTGIGTLVLTGENTYTGRTYVGAGSLHVGDGTYESNLGVTGDVAVGNGALLRLRNADAIADTATLRLESFGLNNGRIEIDGSLEETVAGLWLGNAQMGVGTYGSTSSSATFQNDTWFAGGGMLNVIPEPGTLGVLLIGGAMLFARRRMRG
jgi:autotransporter-associated beta strand protein